MKYHYSTLLLLSLLLVAGCNNAPLVEELPTTVKCTFTLSASMPDSGDPSTRVAAWQVPDSKDIALKWKEGDKIQLYFKSGDAITQGDEVKVQNISTNGKKADFTVEVPAGISGSFDLYGVHGTASETTADGAILLDATPGNFVKLEDAKVPLYFKLENVDTGSPGQTVEFLHFGALQVITLRNTVNENITLENPSLVFSGDKWYHDATGNEYPLYDIVSDEVSKTTVASAAPDPFTVDISFDDNVKLAQWVMPNGKNPPEVNLKAVIGGGEKTTATPKGVRTSPLETGHAYHLYALWDGNGLTFADEADVQTNKITMTTSEIVGSTIGLSIGAGPSDRSGVWIDLNNDGVKDDGEGVTVFSKYQYYTIASQTITLYGKVYFLSCAHNNSLTTLDVSSNTALTSLNCAYNYSLTSLDVSSNTALTTLYCYYNDLTALDVSNNTELEYLYCYNNEIGVGAMTILVNSLPDRNEKSSGYFYVINHNITEDGNVCTTAQVQIAKDKNWEVKDSGDNPYPGS